ncbi:uncharacterized protein LOC120632200 [Pararge aegeria]|uniref:Jg22060 protein n=1 Tax=Pararge aegeria aegeria TaxID=348720 RepID=A0A8S4RJR1_9NEOP|nr:uncharacterized protein LOC120632200 [Pararge aegeria]CAH2238132.1 jg22060 [Pararge aegeria aegeria]
MYILFILFSQVCCDWVEISQNHYKKEPANKVVNFEFTTKPNRIYRNNSLTEKEWHRGVVDKVSNVGHIRQVQYPSVKTSSVMTRPENGFNRKFNYPLTTTDAAEHRFISAKPIKQILNTQDEDDDQNKVIQTTTANVDQVRRPYSKPIKHLPTDQGKIFGEDSVFNRRKQVQISKPTLAETNIDNVDFSESDKFYAIAKPNVHRLDDAHKFDVTKKTEIKYSSTDNTMELNISKIKLIQREYSNNVRENDAHKKLFPVTISSNTEYSEKKKYEPQDSTSSHPLEEYFNSRKKFGNPYKNSEFIVNEANPKKPVHGIVMGTTPSMDEKVTTIPKIENSKPKDITQVSKGNTVKGMWKLIKLVTDTIYKNTHRSFKSKIKYLKSLKTTLLTSIEDQIDRAWPNDPDARGAARSTRSAQARGHVEFPSSESTLMTISFLTFAVFVIKLVLQVIHTYKNKTMMVTPAVVTAVGRMAAALRTPN